MSKEKFDLEVCSDNKAEGLSIKERTSEKEGTSRGNSRSKSRERKSNKFCKCCRKPGHSVTECYKLKNNKKKEEKNNQSAKVSIVDSGLNDDGLLVTTTDNRGATEWVLDFGCTYHMCLHRD